jgi:DNA-binding HxlR family transcriptional regulator
VPEETQLRAKRTRIKILRALANRNGSAGFSDIKSLTGLSTGSIYYHLERMDNYVSKSERHSYRITEEGRELLRQLDSSKTAHSNVQKKNTNHDQQTGAGGGEETLNGRGSGSAGRFLVVLALAAAGIAIMLSVLTGATVAPSGGSFHSVGILLFTAAGSSSCISLHCLAAAPASYSRPWHY